MGVDRETLYWQPFSLNLHPNREGDVRLAGVDLWQHSAYDHDCAADYFQHFYDFRLVWAPEVPAGAAVQSHSHQLADCLRGILLSGSGEQDWVV
jgi:hypothetical protein